MEITYSEGCPAWLKARVDTAVYLLSNIVNVREALNNITSPVMERGKHKKLLDTFNMKCEIVNMELVIYYKDQPDILLVIVKS